MPAPLQNANASKKAPELASSWLHIRCKRADKASWVKAAHGAKLTDWVIDALNKKAK